MITSAEFVHLSKAGKFFGSAQEFVAWLNVMLGRTADRALTLEDSDVRWLLGYRDAPKPRELPFNLEKVFR